VTPIRGQPRLLGPGQVRAVQEPHGHHLQRPRLAVGQPRLRRICRFPRPLLAAKVRLRQQRRGVPACGDQGLLVCRKQRERIRPRQPIRRAQPSQASVPATTRSGSWPAPGSRPKRESPAVAGTSSLLAIPTFLLPSHPTAASPSPEEHPQKVTPSPAQPVPRAEPEAHSFSAEPSHVT
jgi:hypothetical protein